MGKILGLVLLVVFLMFLVLGFIGNIITPTVMATEQDYYKNFRIVATCLKHMKVSWF